MFKVIILLDCDECGNSFHKGNVFSPAQLVCEADMPITTQMAMLRLEQYSELCDWRVIRNYCICPDCIREEEKMADWLEEPEDHKD
jgi:hypothetical protein